MTYKAADGRKLCKDAGNDIFKRNKRVRPVTGVQRILRIVSQYKEAVLRDDAVFLVYDNNVGAAGGNALNQKLAVMLKHNNVSGLEFLEMAIAEDDAAALECGLHGCIPERVIETVEKYRPELMGLKARIDDKFCFDPVYVMEQMRALGDQLEMPIAIHAPRSRIGIEKLLQYMKAGDVLCHTLAGNSEVMNIIDKDGHIKPCVLEARDRGVIFDLSHGTNAYSYDTAEAAWKAGFFTDTVSSDLHGRNTNGPVYNMGVVLSKVRGLTGKPWWWILNKAVAEPVRLQGIPDKAVEVREGMQADLTVFRIDEGSFNYLDSKKENREFSEKATAVYTCLGSKVYLCRT